MTTTDDLKGRDIIDSRNIIEAAADLRAEIEEDPRELDPDEVALLAFDDEEGPCEISEYHDGAGLIAESYFVEYAQELAEDIGAINPDAQWPTRCIDWELAARELRMDYSHVRFLGHDYLVRS